MKQSMKLIPTDRIPWRPTAEAMRIQPFAIVMSCAVFEKGADFDSSLFTSEHRIVLISRQELVIPAQNWTATEANDAIQNPVYYIVRELDRMFALTISSPQLRPFITELLRAMAQNIFGGHIFQSSAIRCYEFISSNKT